MKHRSEFNAWLVLGLLVTSAWKKTNSSSIIFSLLFFLPRCIWSVKVMRLSSSSCGWLQSQWQVFLLDSLERLPVIIIRWFITKETNFRKLENVKHSTADFHFYPHRKSMDFGIFQMNAMVDRGDIKKSHFLGLTQFGHHTLHHFFPTLDHGLLPYMNELFLDTCRDFEMDLRESSWWPLIVGQFQQLKRTKTISLREMNSKFKWIIGCKTRKCSNFIFISFFMNRWISK